MENKLWFKAKTYGWGWTPSSWEGWLVVVLYLFSVFIYARSTVDKALDGGGSGVPLYYHLLMAGVTILLVVISYKKGEKPGWRWPRSEERGRGPKSTDGGQ